MERMIDDHIGEPTEMIITDAETMTLIDTTTGTVVGYAATPPDEVDTIKLAEWIGEHVTQHAAAAAGLRSEKQLWIDTINARFDSRIKAHEGAVAFLKEHWYDRLFELAKTLIGDGKKRSVACGLLKLSLSKSREKVEIIDNENAVEWCKQNAPEAVKVTESVLVSQIPDALKDCLHDSIFDGDGTGMVYHPAGATTKLVIE